MAGEHERAYALEPGDRVGLLHRGHDTGLRGTVREVTAFGMATAHLDCQMPDDFPLRARVGEFFRIGEDGPADGGAA